MERHNALVSRFEFTKASQPHIHLHYQDLRLLEKPDQIYLCN